MRFLTVNLVMLVLASAAISRCAGTSQRLANKALVGTAHAATVPR